MNIDKNSNTLIPHNLLTKFTINNIVFNLHKYNNIDFSSNKSSVLSINNTSSISISNNDYFNDIKINYNNDDNENIYNENIYKDITDIFDKIEIKEDKIELKDIDIKKSDIEILNNNFNIVLKELENFGLNNSLKISNLISENQKLHEEIIILNKKINFLYNHLNLNKNDNENQNHNNKENTENNKSSWYFWKN